MKTGSSTCFCEIKLSVTKTAVALTGNFYTFIIPRARKEATVATDLLKAPHLPSTPASVF